MPALQLRNVSSNFYNDKQACVYVDYGTVKNHAINHEGNPITEEFAHYLQTSVMPYLQKNFNDNKYKIFDIDFINQAPCPFLAVVRTDNQPINKEDLQVIESKMKTAISLLNTSKKTNSAAFYKDQKGHLDSKHEKTNSVKIKIHTR